MNKLVVFSMAVFASVGLMSCGQNNNIDTRDERKTQIEVYDNMGDTVPADLVTFDLNGRVKSCKIIQENDSWPKSELSFDKNGYLSKYEGQAVADLNIKRDKKGRIIELVQMMEDELGEPTFVVAAFIYGDNGKVTIIDYSADWADWHESYEWDYDGMMTKMASADGIESVAQTYEYGDKDEWGNWIKRVVKFSDGSTANQTREIEYYK